MFSIINYIRRFLTRTWKEESCKMVFVVRSDISMGKGKMAAQCAHAAIECYRQTSCNKVSKEMLQFWIIEGQPKVVLKISSEDRLIALARGAYRAGLITALVKDAGRTQIPVGTITVLGIGPGPRSVIDNLTSDLKLL